MRIPSGAGSPSLCSIEQISHSSVQTLAVAGLALFWSFELLGILLQKNTSIHHLYCQAERMLAGELSAFLDKGKDT